MPCPWAPLSRSWDLPSCSQPHKAPVSFPDVLCREARCLTVGSPGAHQTKARMSGASLPAGWEPRHYPLSLSPAHTETGEIKGCQAWVRIRGWPPGLPPVPNLTLVLQCEPFLVGKKGLSQEKILQILKGTSDSYWEIEFRNESK